MDTAMRSDGCVLSVSRKHPKLARDAYPSIFHNCPSYLSSEPLVKRKRPKDRHSEMQTRDDHGVGYNSGWIWTRLHCFRRFAWTLRDTFRNLHYGTL